MSEPQINELIDLERYPIDSLDSPRGTRLLEQCRAELEARALCLLPNFIRPAGLSHLRSESASLIPVAHYRDGDLSAWHIAFYHRGVSEPPVPAGERRSLVVCGDDVHPHARAFVEWLDDERPFHQVARDNRCLAGDDVV